MNKNLSIIIGVVVIASIGFFVYGKNKSDTTPVTNPYTDGTSAPLETLNPNAGGTNGGTTGTAGGNKTSSYTLAQVATHNKAADCWTTINGGVYNVTSWIDQHPGGRDAIISLCGIDGSSAFNAQHGGQRRPASELASFKIGTLKQ